MEKKTLLVAMATLFIAISSFAQTATAASKSKPHHKIEAGEKHGSKADSTHKKGKKHTKMVGKKKIKKEARTTSPPEVK